MHYIIDRFEEDIAVCEDENRHMVNIPKSVLPFGCKEGSKVQAVQGKYVLLDNAADAARIQAKFERLIKHTDSK